MSAASSVGAEDASTDSASAALRPDLVVRGGVATFDQLLRGALEHLGVPGLFGFSVQRQPGRTVAELALAGQFPHAQISVTTTDQLAAAGEAVGYVVAVVSSPGRGFHHTVVVPRPFPSELATALGQTFAVWPNPARAVRR